MNVREVLEFAKKNKVQVVDLKFVDLIGTWQHFTIPLGELTEDLFKDGSGLDGSSIRGWRAINNSDMLVVPDPSTAAMDPFCAVPTLSLIGSIGAALTLGVRGSGLLVALLVLPLFIPVLIFGAGAVSGTVSGIGAEANLSLLGAALMLALPLAPWATAAAVRIAVE